MRPLFAYLSHLSTISAPLLPLIRAISDLCYTNFIECMKKRKEEDGFEKKAEDLMQFFVVHFCSREQVKKMKKVKGGRDRWRMQIFVYLLPTHSISFFFHLIFCRIHVLRLISTSRD